MKVPTAVKRTIADADTPEKVWALVEALLAEQNGYSAETRLQNARSYAAVALKK